MKKTPMGENAVLILMTHYMKHNTLNFNLYINKEGGIQRCA